jgi:hypothetical protein
VLAWLSAMLVAIAVWMAAVWRSTEAVRQATPSGAMIDAWTARHRPRVITIAAVADDSGHQRGVLAGVVARPVVSMQHARAHAHAERRSARGPPRPGGALSTRYANDGEP